MKVRSRRDRTVLRRRVWALLALSLISVPGAAQIERNVGKDGIVEFSNRRQADRARALRKQRETEAVSDGTSVMAPVMPAPSASQDGGRYDDFIREASALYHIPAALIRAVIKSESNFDPRQNILGGTRYLRVLANTFNGNLQLTVAAYNAGAGAVARYGGIPPYAETQAYVARVLEYYQQFRG
jgi:soluble lytic murein transglycosylase-like protein